MIHETELVVGIGVPRPIDFDRTGGLATGRVAKVRRDAAILSLELVDRIAWLGIVAGDAGNPRVQPAGRQQ